MEVVCVLKHDVLKILEEHKGEPVSGLEMGKRLDVSRSAVWKAVGQLKEDGYQIESIPNKGYCLSENNDIIDPEKIASFLRTKYLGREFELLEETDSTNSHLKRNADQLAGHNGYTVVALQQTGGRGRMGRSFYSPAQQGVYMSFLLEPRFTFSDISLATVLAVVAVCRAIEEVAGFRPQVKWVNDVIYHGKKLVGILTEASLETESGRIKYLIPGIGININRDENIPTELRDIVGALNEFSEAPCDRNRLIASVLNHFEEIYETYLSGNRDAILDEYRSLLCVFGKEYNVISPSGSYPATPIDIDREARLIVKDRDSVIHTLNSGEISIRPQK